MKFYEHETLYDYAKLKAARGTLFEPPGRFYGNLEKIYATGSAIPASGMSPQNQISLTATIEKLYFGNSRPYYKVWPSILAALLRFRLDVSPATLNFQHRVFCIRFSEAGKPEAGAIYCRSILTAVILARSLDGSVGKYLTINPICCEKATDKVLWDGTCPIMCLLAESPSDHSTIAEGLNDLARRSGDSPNDIAITSTCLACAITTHLLADDPSIIQPDVLADDRRRFDESADPAERQRLIDKAKRRGIVGWRIGEEYDVCPHYRRPHLALRHTGKGGTIPRIVPVKGAIVHRKKLTDVPTGYLTPEGEEIEA